MDKTREKTQIRDLQTFIHAPKDEKADPLVRGQAVVADFKEHMKVLFIKNGQNKLLLRKNSKYCKRDSDIPQTNSYHQEQV